jgi:hypothetical protein
MILLPSMKILSSAIKKLPKYLINVFVLQYNRSRVKVFNYRGIAFYFKDFHFLSTISAQMSHNVLAVCDGLAAWIRALRSKDQGCKTVGGVNRGRRSRPVRRSNLYVLHSNMVYYFCKFFREPLKTHILNQKSKRFKN